MVTVYLLRDDDAQEFGIGGVYKPDDELWLELYESFADNQCPDCTPIVYDTVFIAGFCAADRDEEYGGSDEHK